MAIKRKNRRGQSAAKKRAKKSQLRKKKNAALKDKQRFKEVERFAKQAAQRDAKMRREFEIAQANVRRGAEALQEEIPPPPGWSPYSVSEEEVATLVLNVHNEMCAYDHATGMEKEWLRAKSEGAEALMRHLRNAQNYEDECLPLFCCFMSAEYFFDLGRRQEHIISNEALSDDEAEEALSGLYGSLDPEKAWMGYIEPVHYPRPYHALVLLGYYALLVGLDVAHVEAFNEHMILVVNHTPEELKGHLRMRCLKESPEWFSTLLPGPSFEAEP